MIDIKLLRVDQGGDPDIVRNSQVSPSFVSFFLKKNWRGGGGCVVRACVWVCGACACVGMWCVRVCGYVGV